MKLRDAFKTHNWLYKQAIAENDTALLEWLLKRKMDVGFPIAVMDCDYTQVKPETVAFLARNLNEGAERRWDKYGVINAGLLKMICGRCLKAQPTPAMVEAFIGSRVPVQKLAELTLEFIDHESDRLSLLGKITGRNAGNLNNADRFARILGQRGMYAEFAFLVDAGFELHKDNQLLLRDMAAQEKKDFIVYLVTKHDADIDVAINTARIAGHDNVCHYLEGIRAEISPDAAPLMSFEDMAREITSLRGTVKDLQQMVTALGEKVQELQNPAKQIDKKPLSTPGKP